MGSGRESPWAHQIWLRLHRERAWLGSFICMALIIAVCVIIRTFAQRAEIVLWTAETPET